MELKDLRQQLELKELEISALLEITQAINNNLPEESLYKIFKFTVISNLKFNKFSLFVYDGNWSQKIGFGTSFDFDGVKPDERFLAIKKIHQVAEFPDAGIFSEFQLAIPITHKGEVLSLMFVGASDEADHSPVPGERLNFLQALSNILVVAIENRKLARRELEQEALRKEIEIAGDVQQLLFPENLPRSGNVIVKASYLPHDLVGGDYYDFIQIDEKNYFLCIADVSGKGVGAALLMSNFQASLRTLVRQSVDLPAIIETLNKRVVEITKGERFITCFLAHIDMQSKKMIYVNSGHIPPVFLSVNSSMAFLENGSTILGAFESLPSIKKGEINLSKTSTLFCFTDGLTETLNEKGEQFGTNWIGKYFLSNSNPDLNRLHQDVIIALDEFKGKNPYLDDITLLSCRIVVE